MPESKQPRGADIAANAAVSLAEDYGWKIPE
jgi:hypothetical protein